ncbi:PC4-domain-containing protein [Trametopsis cervina]|nr:PC4-domain-containing protein [Trametopsis cervina]
MGKRGTAVSSDEDEAVTSHSDYESEDKPPKTKKPAKAKKQVSVKKPRLASDDDEEAERPKKMRAEKPASAKKASKSTDVESGALLVDESGDKYIDLGKKRRATIRAFKGTTYLDIREFYNAGDEEKPGKKGISLSAEQWAILKDNAEIIDALFRKAKK